MPIISRIIKLTCLTTLPLLCSTILKAESASIQAIAHVTDPIGVSETGNKQPPYISLYVPNNSQQAFFLCSVRLPETGSVYIDVKDCQKQTFSKHLYREPRSNSKGHNKRNLISQLSPIKESSFFNTDSSILIVTLSYTEN